MGRKAKILVVDDEKIVRIRLGRALSAEGYEVDLVPSGAKALQALSKTTYDLILSDMVMEDMDGVELLRKVHPSYPETIFMIITGHGSLATAIETMRLGAFDYLLKPCDDSELIFRIQRGLKERRLLIKVKEQQKKLEQLAITDSLTGLYARSYLMEALDREFKHFLRYKVSLSFIMIDLDYFKKINDELGHQAGDEVLKSVARTIRSTIRDADIIGRYGGEEFGIILPKTGWKGAQRTATRLLQGVRALSSEKGFSNKIPHQVTVSVGIASCPHRKIKSPAQLLQAADTALYEAKRAGRDRLAMFGAADAEAAQELY
ncbi:MAG: diguanylate cyclase [Planctomycetes bacterium]|nr:diguanylate cyclase [Planctomycetota bacterium]